MPRGFNTAEKDSIRRTLLEAGRAKLITTGMHKTSVEALARAAHISKGAFYQFFPTKEALFITLFAEAERAYRTQLREFAQRPGPTPAKRLHAFFREAMRCYRDMPLFSKFSREDMHALTRTRMSDMMETAVADGEAFIVELFGIWRKSGVKMRCTPRQFAAVMQMLMVADLNALDMGKDYASALDLLLQALADKLTQ
jgi:AcrR family transcriptional regulator